MSELLLKNTKANRNRAVPVVRVSAEKLAAVKKALSPEHRAWIDANGFKAGTGALLALPGADGRIAKVLFGAGSGDGRSPDDPFAPGTLVSKLPKGIYRFEGRLPRAELAALSWLLDAYRFDRYRSVGKPAARLVAPDGTDVDALKRISEAVTLTRDLINTPADDMGPGELETAMRSLARGHKARVSVVKGGDLLKKNFPLIHAVGRASDRAPRLIDMSWGPAKAPKVTLVGKGVCFDTGGLNLKPGSSMALMKKDMGGAANVLGLASMIMAAKLPVRLRVLVPAVDNNVSANAFRPGDVFPSRAGLSVEIGNTDAEGRLVLADALALADAEKPDLLVDMATLTGAARVALGPDLPPFYTDDDKLAGDIARMAGAQHDPLWRMPFWNRYDGWLDSKIADVNHISEGGFAGSLTAALFLRRFVANTSAYVHFDVYGWTPSAIPGHPHGGAAQGIRALFAVIGERYAK